VAEADEPFRLPGIDRDICLARIGLRPTYDSGLSSVRRSRSIQHYGSFPEGARVIIDGEARPIPRTIDAGFQVRYSRRWADETFEYRYVAREDDRPLPPAGLIAIAKGAPDRGPLFELVEAACDGNFDCVPSEKSGVHWPLVRTEWTVNVIYCGEPFRWAVD